MQKQIRLTTEAKVEPNINNTFDKVYVCVSDKKSKIIGRSHLHDAVVMADEAPNARAYFEREHFVVATIATVPTDTTKWQENRQNYRMNRNKYGFFGGVQIRYTSS